MSYPEYMLKYNGKEKHERAVASGDINKRKMHTKYRRYYLR